MALQTCMAADVMSLTASSPEVRGVFEKALTADARKLTQWSSKPEKSGVDLQRFCPEYEKKYLKALFGAFGEYKTHIVTARAALSGGERGSVAVSSLDEADEAYRQVAAGLTGGISSAPGFGEYAAAMRAKAEVIRNLYLLMSFRPTSKDTLRTLLALAKAAAEAAGTDPGAKQLLADMDKSLAGVNAITPLNLRVRISQGVAHCYNLSTVKPLYPPSLRSARVQGAAVLRAVIGSNGRVQQVTPVSGDPDFIASATESVRQWTYRPYYLSGEPVEFETQITINYNLSH